MPTHDYIIANGTGAAVRADINLALSAIVSLNSSASEPATMYAYQLWADTGSNPSLLKIRNGANSAWITLRQLDGDFSIVAVEDGLQATPSLTFTNDLNTGIFRPGNDSLAIVTGATRAITITSTQAVGIQTANPNAALHVAGNARVGADDVTDAVLEIGAGASGNRNSFIDIVADTTYTDYGLRVIRNNTGANATSELKHRGTGALNFTTEEAAPIVFYTTNSPSMTITSGGLVGIGTSGPSYQLDLDGGTTVNTRIRIARGSDDNQAMRLGYNSIDLFRNVALESAQTSLAINQVGSDGTRNVFQIDPSGLVGIGVTSPAVALHVAGSARSSGTGNYLPVSGGTTWATDAAFIANGSYGGALSFVDGSNGFTAWVANSGASLYLGYAAVSGTPTVHSVFTNTGRLLVGTSTANTSGAKLQTSDGLTFPATQVASADPNTLDDYEEGTWEPTISGDSTAGTGTYTFQLGAYTKVGRLVTVQAKLGWTAHTGTGGMLITNLPFSTFGTNGSSYACGSVGFFTGLTVPASNIVTLLVQHAGANYILIVNTPVGGGDSSQTAMDTAVAEFFFSATYMTAT